MKSIDQSLIIVEDEPLISLMIRDVVVELGWLVIGSAHSEEDAFKLLGQCHPRVALLDINLGPTTSLAVASTCQDRGIAVVFITGYTARDIPAQCRNMPVLAKPFTADELGRSLKRAMSLTATAA